MRKKIISYLGFANKSKKLITGNSACKDAIEKNKLKLLILTEDISQNTAEKLIKKAAECEIPYRSYGSTEELSAIAGCTERSVYGILDNNFAKIIMKEIENEQSKKKEVFK